MREACTMSDDYRVTIRLSPELYAQLEALSRHGAPVAAIVRRALADYLARPLVEPPRGEDPTLSLAAIAASLTDLHAG
jgi:predicted transcriptional regulator